MGPDDPGLARTDLARLHRYLFLRATHLAPDNVDGILDLGTAVVLHGLLERGLKTRLASLLDDSVVTQLAQEHEQLSDDLQLLEALWHYDRGSSDLRDLSGALLDRLRRHVGRDQRLYYGSDVDAGSQGFGPDTAPGT